MESSRRSTDNASDFRIDPELLRVGLAALLGLVLVVLLSVDLFGGSPGGSAGERVVLTENEALARAGKIEPRAYWVGRRPGIDTYELEKDEAGNLFVRYLPEGWERGDPAALGVATYPVADARASLRRAAVAGDQELIRLTGLTVLAPPDGGSAFAVFDDQPGLQIEVFSPDPGLAAELVRSGALTPLGWEPIE